MDQGLARHVAAATRLRLPGGYGRLTLGGVAVGFVQPDMAERLVGLGAREADGGVDAPDAGWLTWAQRVLAEAGVFRPRGEAFDVRAAPDGAVLGQVDRGALPVFGIVAHGVHVNGLVRDGDGWRVWVGRRSAAKRLDAGKLDHLVAGGICAGMDAAGTLVKEAWEEASIPAALAEEARFVGCLGYSIERAEGLRRDVLHCYDLVMPADFVPVPQDGEVEEFTLMPLEAVMRRVAETDDYKFNVNLVLLDLFARMGMIGDTAGLAPLRR